MIVKKTQTYQLQKVQVRYDWRSGGLHPCRTRRQGQGQAHHNGSTNFLTTTIAAQKEDDLSY